MPRASGRQQRYCGPTCAKAAERDRAKARGYRRPARSADQQRRETDRKRDLKHRRRARMKDGDAISLSALVERDEGICHLCGRECKPGARSVDHLVPLSLGGAHVWSNVKLAHVLCNARRGNRPLVVVVPAG